MNPVRCVLCLMMFFLYGVAQADDLPWVRVADDVRGLRAIVPSGRSFVPWGFNYDHDEKGHTCSKTTGKPIGPRLKPTLPR